MALTQDIIGRLVDRAGLLHGRVEGAAQFAHMMAQNRLPQVTPAANVLPLGMTGGQPDAGAGMFTQMVDETVAVILTTRTGDPVKERGRQLLDDLIDEVVLALCGWAPNDEVGVMVFVRSQLVAVKAGAVVYQIDFKLSDQLRIAQ
ncbi:MAG: hypothetical protein AAFY65_13090 [Pseudomonadota bacterium]